MEQMQRDLDRFGKIVRGFIRSNCDKETNELVEDPVKWLAVKMEKSTRTIGGYLSNPSTMTLDTRALLKQVIREKLIYRFPVDESTELIFELIDAIQGRDNAKR